jgi:hypothetical protein
MWAHSFLVLLAHGPRYRFVFDFGSRKDAPAAQNAQLCTTKSATPGGPGPRQIGRYRYEA